MATEEDNFDIDIYGDGGEDYQEEGQVGPNQVVQAGHAKDNVLAVDTGSNLVAGAESLLNGHETCQEIKSETGHDEANIAHQIGSTDESTLNPVELHRQAPQTQGLKRKEGADDRFVDPGATSALYISELPWWITDDDIRGWANQSECEDELEEITFSEHKVNGKSKGQAYVVFKTPQAATAAKHKIEGFGEGQKYRQKFLVNYTNPYTNPFKTLPKDGPTRNGPPANRSSSVGYNSSGSIGVTPQQAGYNPNNGYRGRGGGFNNRGSVPNMGGYTRASFQQPIPGSYQSGGVNGYQSGPVGPMPQYGGFQSRGGLMGGMRGATIGMRGGRGGMNGGGMMGIPMGGMGLGAMPVQMPQMPQMPLNMPQMSAGMGMQGFHGGQSHYNPAFFAQQQGGPNGGVGDASWNPHGAKRTRQE